MLLVFVLNAGASGYSQKVTLNLRNVWLSKVLTEIRKQTGLNFFYNATLLKQTGKVSIQVNDASLEEVLEKCLKDQPVSYEIRNNTIILSEKTYPYEIKDSIAVQPPAETEIKGTVLDDSTGKPLQGAAVQIKATSKGTTTDAAGNFSLTIPADDASKTVLLISFIGYETAELPVSKTGAMQVKLKIKIAQAEEIVVVGYGTQKKKEVTNAIAQVSGKEILESQSVTISNAIAGKIPGLIVNQRSSRPGADGATYYIRGISTYRDASALIVVDGVANRDGIDRVDPNDIESFTVLKDASAAIYGAQGGNGVILITTKRGKAGKPSIGYSFNHGFVSPVRLMKIADAATYASGVNDLALQNGQPLPYSDEVIADYESGKSPSYDWYDIAYRDNFSQSRHSLTVSGGSDAVKFFLSAGTTYQGSILTNDNTSKYRQYNFRSNIDAKVNKLLTIGFDVSGRRQNGNYTYLDENTIYSSATLTPPTVAPLIDGLPTRGRSNNNPLAIVTSPAYDKTEINLINGTLRFDLQIPFVKGLSVDGFAALDNIQSFRKRWQQPHYFYEEDTTGVLQKLPNNTSTSLTEIIGKSNSYTLNAKLKYENTFSKIHAVTAFVAVEQNQTRTDNLTAGRTGFVSPQIDELFTGSAINQTNTGNALETARLNYFGRVGYTFNNKYIVQFQMRYDGSQIFPSDKRFGYFPGGSVGWVISEESFLKNSSLINSLKLRASYGILGNDRVQAFQYLDLFRLSTVSGTGFVVNGQDYNVLNPGVAANPNITWEKKKSFDIGVEGGLLKNKIVFEIDYFSMRTEDILAKRSISVPGYTGLSSILPDENIGIVSNKGIDGQVTYRGKAGAVHFNVGCNFTYAKNKLVFIDEGDFYPEPYQKSEGQPVGALLLYQATGIYRTQEDLDTYPGLNSSAKIGDVIYADMNGDKIINQDDRVRADKSVTPKMQYGLLFGAGFKGFDLSGNFMGQTGAITQYDYVFGEGNNTPSYYITNAWSPDNPNGSLPRLSRGKANNGEGNTLNTRSVSFIRLKNIELGYTLPKHIISKAGFQGARVYINAYNILTFDKLKKDGLNDPESINPQGWQFPQSKSVNIGINVNL